MNIDKMVEVSQVSNELNKREVCIKNYEKSYKSGKIFTILSIVLFVIIAYYLKIDLKFVIPLLIVFPCILIFYIKKIKQNSDNIRNNNEPLMVFESEILKLYIMRIARNHVKPRRYYMDLKEPQITLDITKEQYDEFMKNDIRKVRVYFIEELLRNFNSYEIEGIKEI